jgi:thiamine kinase-like enzyme
MCNDDVQWRLTSHRTKKFDLYVSSDGRLFKKQTERLHSRLEAEYNALKVVKELNLPHFQVLIEGNISDDISYIITEYCGVGITSRRLPKDFKDQLNTIQKGLDTLKDHKVYHNDVLIRNILVHESKLTLIDFDMSTIGKPDRRGSKRPVFNTCQLIFDKIRVKWGM